jgi:hypothetical protein
MMRDGQISSYAGARYWPRYASMTRIQTYADFFPYYLREHRQPASRGLHYVGTVCSLAAIVLGVWTGNPWWFPAALIGGYGPAWIGHFFIEKNRPATFQYPFWSLISDYRMFFLWITGRLGPALVAAGAKA